MFFRNIGSSKYRRYTNELVDPLALFEVSEKEADIMKNATEIGVRVEIVPDEVARAELSAQFRPVVEETDVVAEEAFAKAAAATKEAPPVPEKKEVDFSSLGDAPQWDLTLQPREYLKKYPGGQHAERARAVIDYDLKRQELVAGATA